MIASHYLSAEFEVILQDTGPEYVPSIKSKRFPDDRKVFSQTHQRITNRLTFRPETEVTVNL